MVSLRRQPKHAFTPNDLQAIDLALVGAVATARELGVFRAGLDVALRRRLMEIASEGITDPEKLQNELLKSMNLDRAARSR